MKVIVYDPLFSSVGHFFRYNKHVLSLLSDNPLIREIEYISNGKEGDEYKLISPKISVAYGVTGRGSSQIKSYQTKGLKKVILYVGMMRNYLSVIKYINNSNSDFCFFTSNGMVPFWMAALVTCRVNFVVSVISLKWFYDCMTSKHLLYVAYSKFLKKASLIFVTEEVYRKVLSEANYKSIAVLHDRWLQDLGNDNDALKEVDAEDNLRLLTLGTISHMKNPIAFVKLLQSSENNRKLEYCYDIYGKSLDKSGEELGSMVKNSQLINYYDDYIENVKFDSLMKEADIIVIPYDGDYTKFMTSGVMWDCFKYKKPILCPDLEPFRYYIETFNIGFIYTPETLQDLLDSIVLSKNTTLVNIQENYRRLYNEISHENLLKKFMHDLKMIEGVA